MKINLKGQVDQDSSCNGILHQLTMNSLRMMKGHAHPYWLISTYSLLD